MWPTKPKIFICGSVCDKQRRNSKRKSEIFDHGEFGESVANDGDSDGQSQDKNSAQYDYIAISGCYS